MSPVMRVLAAVLFAAALSSTAQASPEQEAANKAAVLAFYEKGLNQKDADAALRYLGDRYVQHNPNAADGPEGFRKFVAFLRDKYPQSRSEIKRVFTDGDYVILHVHAVREPGTRGNAIIDIFRLERAGSSSTGTRSSRSPSSPPMAMACSERHAARRAAAVGVRFRRWDLPGSRAPAARRRARPAAMARRDRRRAA